MIRAEIRKVGAAVVALEQAGLGLVPLTRHVRHALGEAHTGAELMPGFFELPGQRTGRVVVPARLRGVCTYGISRRHRNPRRIGWVGGAIAWGPSFTCNHQADSDEHYALSAPEDMAINVVLRWLGVHRGEAVDEFESVGLTRFRRTNEWAAIAT